MTMAYEFVVCVFFLLICEILLKIKIIAEFGIALEQLES